MRITTRATLAGLALLALAGCGGGAEPQVASALGTESAAKPNATDEVTAYVDGMRAWVTCLRGEGLDVSDPDPTGTVTFPGDSAALKSDPKFAAAQEKCASLLPTVPEKVEEMRRPEMTPEEIEVRLQYARCMQQNGAPDFPDPGSDGYTPRDREQWNQDSAGARQAARACASIIGDPENPGEGQG
jgi:hypothetical protein